MKLDFEPSPAQICMMCHFSSECEGCCEKCSDQCNHAQLCGLEQPANEQTERLNAWINIINSNEMFSHLKRYMK